MIEIENYVHIITGSKEEAEEVRLLFEEYEIPYYLWVDKYTLITDTYFSYQIYELLENNLDDEKLGWR